MTQISDVILEVKDGVIFCDSLQVAEKFEKAHKVVLLAIKILESELTGSSDSWRRNFIPREYVDSRGKLQPKIMMTRNGFSLLAMGFTGKESTLWKTRFIDAFEDLEKKALEEIPALQKEIEGLRSQLLLLPEPKKQHGNKGLIWVTETIQGLFGLEVVQRKATPEDDRFSKESKLEGQIRQHMAIAKGHMKKVEQLSNILSIVRRS
jgi:Rha family phage regulatory protein